MAEPCLPINSLDATATERRRRRSAYQERAGTRSVASPAPPRPGAQAARAWSAHQTAFWRDLSAHIDGRVAIPDIPELRLLLALPQARRVVPDHPLSAELNTKQIAGLIIQATGQEADGAGCTGCRRGEGPFPTCVRLSAADADDVAGLLRTARRACGNCLIRRVTSACSIKGHADTYARVAPLASFHDARGEEQADNDEEVDHDGDTVMDDATLAARLSMLGRRRSARISLAQTEQNAEDEGDAEGEQSDEAPLAARRVVTLRVPPQQRVGRRQTAMPVLQTRTPPSEADLRMEEWEMEGGRLEVDGERTSVLFGPFLPSPPFHQHITALFTPLPSRI